MGWPGRGGQDYRHRPLDPDRGHTAETVQSASAAVGLLDPARAILSESLANQEAPAAFFTTVPVPAEMNYKK